VYINEQIDFCYTFGDRKDIKHDVVQLNSVSVLEKVSHMPHAGT
jgi:hypothetical protein